MADGDVPAEYGTDGGGVALECRREVEQCGKEGYFTGSAGPEEMIRHSYAYPLPHRGIQPRRRERLVAADRRECEFVLEEQSVSDEGLHREDDALHPQWVMIDLGAKVDVNAIRIAWANPYARRYAVQFGLEC